MKKILSVVLSVAILMVVFAFPASAATSSATLDIGEVSAWTGSLSDTQLKLTSAMNYPDSARKVYFDFKYYNGKEWKTDKNAVGLDVNRSIVGAIDSSVFSQVMSLVVQINTFNCWFTDGHAYGAISTT